MGSSSPSAVFIPSAAESRLSWWYIHLALIYFLSLCLIHFSSFAECLWSGLYVVPLGLRNILFPLCFNNSSFYFSTVRMPSSLTLKHTIDRTAKSRLYFCFSNTASLSIGSILISAFIFLDLLVSFHNNYFDFYNDHLLFIIHSTSLYLTFSLSVLIFIILSNAKKIKCLNTFCIHSFIHSFIQSKLLFFSCVFKKCASPVFPLKDSWFDINLMQRYFIH